MVKSFKLLHLFLLKGTIFNLLIILVKSASYEKEINNLSKELSKSKIQSDNLMLESNEIQLKQSQYVKDLKHKM